MCQTRTLLEWYLTIFEIWHLTWTDLFTRGITTSEGLLVIYQTRKTVFDHIFKHPENSRNFIRSKENDAGNQETRKSGVPETKARNPKTRNVKTAAVLGGI